MIDRGGKLPVKRQCELLDLSRTGVYYTPRPVPEEDLRLMRRIDELHLKYPYRGGSGSSDRFSEPISGRSC